MKRHKFVVGFSVLLFMLACADRPFYDVYRPISGRRWHHQERLGFHVPVTEKGIPYDVWIYIRHTGEYDFANLAILSHATGAGLNDTLLRHELNLSTPDGRWTGKTAGNIYENMLLLKENFVFPDTGTYTFEIEHNMQEDPLRYVTDVGLKIVEK